MTSPTTFSASVGPAPTRARLGDLLVEHGALSVDDLQRAVELQRTSAGDLRIGRILQNLGLVHERDVARALAELHQLPLVDLDHVTIDPITARVLPRTSAERLGVLVYAQRGDRLVVAVVDPVDVVALDDVRAITGIPVLDVSVATETQIRTALSKAWTESERDDVVAEFIHQVSTVGPVEEQLDATTDAASIRLVDRMIVHAARNGASDIHVEPRRDGVFVRLRIDGVLREVMTLPRSGYSAIAARLKIIAELDVIERRLPQDGRARVAIDGDRIDVRVSTLPALHGEKVVVRLLPPSSRLPSLPSLGLEPEHQQLLLDVVSRPQGLVLVTGPTGSGKTNTLYATLVEGVDHERNVITLEDPVEIELPGLTQVPIHDKHGMNFARGLRAALRQDPDVIFVGEVRDRETAELTIRAALTGHLVLSTLHTLDAAAAVTRLVDMGVPAFLVTSSLSLVVSQRLVRRPCPDCAAPDLPEPAVLAELCIEDPHGDWLRAVGCPVCAGTGYRGRSAVVEMLQVDATVRRALLDGASEDGVRRAAIESGMVPMLGHAVEVARRGGTTLSEVLRAVPREGR